jgi:GNAT superfamily N-acetyltransferase
MASKRSNGYDDAFMDACADELRVHPKQITLQSYWIAEEGQLMGCVCLNQNGATGTINTFFIHPDHKRKGIGRALWEQVAQVAAAKELTLLKLDADPAAVPFYEAIGFRTVSEAPSGSIPGRMLPHMHLTLEPVRRG